MEAAGAVFPLENGNYLVYSGCIDTKTKKLPQYYRLFNSEWKEIRLLDQNSGTDNIMVAEKVKDIIPFLVDAVCGEEICIGNSERGYEILVYDGQGQLRRKIRKEYKAVTVSEDYKKKKLAGYPEMFEEKLDFPKNWPAFLSFFSDDEGRLFVMTPERGEVEEEYIFDIFNADGIFIARKALSVLYEGGGIVYARAKNNRLYGLREKESGYKELVVYKMEWE
jgi:hypothetical protein